MKQSSKAVIDKLKELAASTPSGDMVEIGSCCGGTSGPMAEAGKGKTLYCVDPYEKANEYGPSYIVSREILIEWRQQFEREILQKYDNVIHFQCDLTECIDKIPDGLSLVFIDGRHEYDFAFREFNLLVPKLCSGGALVLHDINWNKNSGAKKLIDVANLICEPQFRDIEILEDRFNAKVGIKV